MTTGPSLCRATHRRRPRAWPWLLCAVALGGAEVAGAAPPPADPPWLDLGPPPDPADRAIQRRKHQLAHELALQAGALPASPFYRGATLSLGYTLHFNDFVGWQIASFTYAFNSDSNLKTQLLLIVAQLRAGAAASAPVPTVPDLPELQWMLASHLVVKPIYGKQALGDVALVHTEAYVQAGPAVVSVLRQLSVTALTAGVDAGIGVRLWLGHALSLRAEFGDVLYVLPSGLSNTLHLQAGIALNLGGDA